MQMVRTTLRLKTSLKKAAERLALENDTTLQELFNDALEAHLREKAKRKARKIVFRTHDLGKPLDNLRRADYYTEL